LNLDKPEEKILLPKSFQVMLNVESGKDEVLDEMLANHGWTGKYFTSPPDWATYVKILTRASNTFSINSKLYSLLAAGLRIQEGTVQTDRSSSQSDHAQLFGQHEIEQPSQSSPQFAAQSLCFADLLPGPQFQQQVDAAGAYHAQAPSLQAMEESPKRSAAKPSGQSKYITTLMIQHLPPETQQREILEELDRSGFKDLYDFCHVPCDFSKKVGLGFAFVNFVSESIAAMFMTEWHGSYRFSKTTALNIRPAAVQGYEDNVNKWSSQRLRRIRNPNFRPYIVEKVSQPREDIPAVDGFQDELLRGRRWRLHLTSD